MELSAIITILILFLGIPVGIMVLRDVLRRFKIRNPLFWGLAPILLIFGVLMPLCIEWTQGRAILILSMELCIVFALLGLFNAQRFFWAFRALALMIFLAYGSYLIHEFAFTDKPLALKGSRSDASPRNSLIGFFIFGLPCLWFAVTGRFTLKEGEDPEEECKALEERILSPDWTFYVRHLQRPAPTALRELFADRGLVTNCGLEFAKSDGISTFNPLDEHSLLDTADLLGFDVVPFATSDCGDAIFLRPGKDESDTVYIAYHDDPGKGVGWSTFALAGLSLLLLVAQFSSDATISPSWMFVCAGLTGTSGIVALVFRFTEQPGQVIVHRFPHWPGQPPVIHLGR